MYKFIFLLCICLAFSQEFKRFSGSYKGEGVNCGEVSANVSANSNLVVSQEEGVAVAVAQAVADASALVANSPTDIDLLVAQAEAVAQVVVSSISRAVAFVSGEINSPNAGCWAIAYGEAEAIAIANATAFAVAEGLTIALLPQDKLLEAQAAVQTAQNDIQLAIQTVALLLADGSGSGRQEGFQSVEAVAKAEAVNCALVTVFAAVANSDAVAEVFANTGCVQISAETGAPSSQIYDQNQFTGCDCVTPTTNKGVVPNFCGKWGDQKSGDAICYVEDPSTCACAQASVKYVGDFQPQAWRYCGPTLEEMQFYLTLEDEFNNINGSSFGFGYCPPQVLNTQENQAQSTGPSVPILSQGDIPPPPQNQNPLLAIDDAYNPFQSTSTAPPPKQNYIDKYPSPPAPNNNSTITIDKYPPPSPVSTTTPTSVAILMPTQEEHSPVPSPTPDPTPTPDFQGTALELISQCPLYYCIEEAFECCKKSGVSFGSKCNTSDNNQLYVYVGKCAVTLQDVWQPTSGNTCKCIE